MMEGHEGRHGRQHLHRERRPCQSNAELVEKIVENRAGTGQKNSQTPDEPGPYWLKAGQGQLLIAETALLIPAAIAGQKLSGGVKAMKKLCVIAAVLLV